MRRKWNRLLALLLCVLMMSSELTGFITPAQAAPAAPDAISAAAPLADTTTAEHGEPKDFDADENARPNLFVHFLGDNYFYPYDSGAGGVNQGIGLGQLPVPAGFDQSKESNPDSTDPGAGAMDTPGNTWNRYRSPTGDMVAETATSGPQVIFWVGLGVDRREIFELLKDNKGLTSLEAGFYYDNRYIEPYVDPTGDFKATIEKANINNHSYPANTQWSSDYEILRAETGLEPKTDAITQEEVISPSFNEIMANSDWRMTYVSLELTDPLQAGTDRRLAGEYVGVDNLPTDGNGDPVTPDSAHGTGMQNAGGVEEDNDYQYLLLIPFRLKRYGDPQRLALRLARNATHFSMGAGEEGERTYAAWERVTTRNPGKDIKLLTRFNGDLFLFGDPPNSGEVEYTATLYLDQKTVLNTAELSVDGDPAVWPVKATQNKDVISGLRSGLGMRIKTDPQIGYTVSVTVKYKDVDGNYIIHTYQTVTTDREYTFVMPEVPNQVKDVEVHIGFSIDNPQYHVFLSEIDRDALGAVTTDKKLGNSAVITTNLDNVTGAATATTVEIHSFDPPFDPHPTHPAGSLLDTHGPGPMGNSDTGNRVKIEVSTHADYMAVVRIGNFNATGSLITSDLNITTARNDHRLELDTTSPNYGKITLPYGGTITLTMPANDLDVEITYQPAPRYKATLEVYHKDGSTVTPMNTAQMAYLIYDDFNDSSTAYSGVVYHLKDDTVPVEDHRAVKGGADNKKLPWVAASQATQSGSLAGDTGRTGMDWNPAYLATPEDPILGLYTVMTQLRSATDLTSFATSMAAVDLNSQAVGSAWTGLRKDLQGQGYGDGDVAQFKSYLWEMRTRILSDPALKALYDKTVTETVGTTTTTLYSYLDLTAAQVQAYVLDILAAQETQRANQRQYDLAYQEYLTIKALRDVEDSKSTLAGMIAPLDAPIAPELLSAADSKGIRSYQGADYQNGSAGNYLYDYYAYLQSYHTYITAVAAAGSVSGIALPGAAPGKKALHTIDILTDAAAQTKLAGFSFRANPVSNSPSIETREDRKVWVALEGDGAYYVESVRLYDVDGFNNPTNLITTIIPTKDSNYANLWSFTMPKKNCAVRVTYARRSTRDLMVQIIDANGESENLASVEAYRYADHDLRYPAEVPAVAPVLDKITNDGNQNVTPYPPAPTTPLPANQADPRYIYNVFMDGTVTVRVKAKEGYSTEVKFENLGRGDTIPYTKVTAPNPADGDIYTFTVVDTGIADDVISVKITYIEEKEQYDAYIDYYTVPGSTPDPGNEALWRLENAGPPPSVTWTDYIPDVYVGTHLVGDVTVQPGYYIYGVVARGASGNYTYVMSGDGYNNGYGTMVSGTNQPVKIDVNMPAEDLYVEVYFKEGPPPAEPDYPLTLTVHDPDNRDPNNQTDDISKDDPAKWVNNWAKATVYDLKPDGTPDTSSPLVTLGEVGRKQTSMTDHTFTQRGKWVKVEFEAVSGYHVSKVTVGPSELGVALIWESANSVSFYMPAGSAGICVEFAKGEPPAYFLNVRETWFDMTINGPVTGAEQDNYVTYASSGTIKGWNANNPVQLRYENNPERVPGAGASADAKGAAVSGEEVTMTYIVDENNWYVQSIILFSDGAATRLTDNAVEIANVGGKKTYEVKFHMPSSDAEFTVHYRKGPRPKQNDYAFTMVLYDSDNTAATKDDNRLSATFTDAVGGVGVHSQMELGLGLATPITTDVRHIHPGDIVTLETQLQPGYTVDYMIINPSNLGLYPSWQSVVTDANGVTKGVAKFTMPSEGVAVVARYIKGEPHRYTANLILRPPAGYTVDDVGMGTFAAPTTGNFTNYPTQAIFSTAQSPGTAIDYDLYAKDGFYIKRVTIEPAVGATGSLTGSFGYQNGDFVMPAANVYVNVWFEKGWPDEATYDLTLRVHDASERDGNYANFHSAGSTLFNTPDSDRVHGGQVRTIRDAAFDRDVVVVDIATETGYYCDPQCITITDTQDNSIGWWHVPGGIAFTMPPRSTTVDITFKEDPGDRPTYKADLRVIDAKTGQAVPADNDEVKLEALSAGATGSPLTANGTIGNLHPHDALKLTTRPGTGRHIAAAYAVYTSGGNTGVVPIYEDGALVAPPALAQMVPGNPANAVTGSLVMPEADVTVYVRFADKALRDTDKWVNLKVSGPAEAGHATALINEGVTVQSMSVRTPGSTTPAGAVSGMDTRITTPGREVIVTFEPKTADGYDITKLEVYDRNGDLVPYEWISMVQDPPVLTDTGMWPNPPTDPSPGIGHPNWVKNPKRQIKLNVPIECVTVHVTYGKVDQNKEFTAQIVVNDPYPANTTPASRNNAWFGLLDDALKARLRTAKPGEWIDLSVNVHPGYRIEYIKVVPQSYGIAPGLPMGDIYDQNTGFYMPNGDVTVYVKFTTDATERKTATVMAIGAPTGNPANYATIHSPINGTSDHATVNGTSRVVEARPVVDWITVDYYWAAGDAIESITVQTKDGSGGTDIPYTQNEDIANRHGQIVLPMAARDVLITIVYKDDPTPVGQEVVLHVIDKGRGVPAPIVRDPDGATPLNYGRLEAVYAVGADTGLVGPDTYPLATDPYESTATIFVPAGERVDVTACSDALGLDGNGKVYIESAYVLYEAGGQMLNMNLQPDSATPPPYGFSGEKNSHFIVHQGRNDVYVTLTRKAPTQNEYSAVLMLKGPDDNSGQAGICVGSSYDTAPADRRDELTQANHGHAYVTATQGEGITINVVPAEGYVIDYIQVTPLGYPLSYTFLPTENTINFDMPHCNIAVTVYLKKAEKDQHTLTLHYLEDTGGESKDDYAKISWTKDDGTQEDIWAWHASNVSKTPPGAFSNGWDNVSSTMVKGGAPVTLWATLDDPDVILAAYVLSEGELVPLTPTFPAGLTPADGLEGVGESASAGDNAKADALATFDMPNADAHVYLVTTNTPPHPDWHTIILTASDTSPAGNNRGVNHGYLNEKGKPDSDSKKVWSYGGTSTDPLQPDHVFLSLPEYKADGTTLNYFTVVTEPAPTYELSISKTHMTKNTPVYIQSLSPVGTTPTIHYEEPVGDCNKVVHLVFESQEDLTLTVEIDDPDNPGNGTVTNAVTTATTGVDTLNLYSQSIAGAYQIMSGVTAGAPVDLTVTPAPGYHAYAYLYTVGADPVEVPLTVATNGVMTGSFTMPPNTSRVVVTFYIPYDGTLVLRDNTGYPTTKAQMTESTGTAPDRVSVNALLTPSATLTKLPSGTELVANMVDYYGVADTDKKVTGLLTTKGSTTFLAPVNDAGIDYYKHTIDRADATITLVVDEKGVSGEDYVAAVRVVNRPATLTDAQMPTIVDTTTSGKVSGSIWTTADDTDGIRVHVTVPAGYTAQLTTDSALGLDGGTNTAKTLTADSDTTFVMPAHNVQVTVTYTRTHHRLTLHIADTSGVAGNATALTPAAAGVLGSGLTTLTADGQSTYVKDGTAVDLSATPATDAKIKYIFYQVAGQPPQFVTVTDPTAPFSAVPLLSMPAADVDVTVVYTSAKTPDPPPDPDPMDYYIALAVKDDPSGEAGNQILSIRNTTRTTLLDGTALPSASPVWTAGYGDDAVQVSYQAAPGYYVQVTAKAADGTPILPVLQIGDTSLGTATTAFPTVGEDIVITVTYTTVKPPRPEQNVALQLVEHKQEVDNKAQTTDFTASALLGLTLNGTHTDHDPHYPQGVASDDPVEIVKPKSTAGNDLRTLANWANNYQVVRMTVAVRDTNTNAETGEVDLLVSRYGGNATSRCPMPPVGADEIAVVRVYYGNIYDATLHVVGADVPYDVTKATDNRPSPISSTGTVPITDTGDKLMSFQGGEQVQTTAIPDAAAVGGVKKRLVGVVWESDLTGAQPTTSGAAADRYDFNMPKDNVDFYAIYEPEPDDPKDKTYIAKVALDSQSYPIAGTQNALSIRNTDDATAAKGKYWVAAKGGDSIEVDVKVAKGYRAQIVATKVDDQSASVLNALPDILDADGVTTRKPTAADDYQYDISRTQFVYNLPSGKDATFTMPADTDATVTVRFIKGYDLTLDVADASLLDKTGFTTEENTVELTYDFADDLTWKNNATTADATVATDGVYDPDPAVLKDREGGKSVTTDVSVYDPDIKVKVTRTTPFTGTTTLTNTAPATDYPFTMPYENTLVSVLLRDKDAQDDLLAKVELQGDSDVVGNTATPVVDRDTPAPATTTGVVWTTTDEGHLIDLTLTVRAGYVAKIKVRRDNDNYYNNLTDPTKWDYLDAWRYQFTKTTTSGTPATSTTVNMVSDPGAAEANITEVSTAYGAGYQPASLFPDTISGQQHFRFLMPKNVTASGTPGDPGYVMGDVATDVTIIVTFEKVNDMPRPYDPDNLKMDKIDLDRGFIYGENRGDYAVIEIPTLAQEEGESTVKLFDTDNYDKASATPVIHDAAKAADKEVKRYIFALYDAAADQYTELAEGTDVILAPYDEDTLAQAGDLYNYILGLYHGSETLDAATAQRDFVGSKFLLLPKPKADGTFTANGQKVYDMLNNKGSLESYQAEDKTTHYRTTLAVMAEDATKRQSEYTPVWIRPWFALGVNVISYAPTHELHGQLYRLMDEHELNVRNGYWDEDENVIAGTTATLTTPDKDDIKHYRWDDDQEPTVDDFVVLEDDAGSGKWFQVLQIRSSELLGAFTTDYDPAEDFTATPPKTLLGNVKATDELTYALLVKKDANLTYTRIKIDLNPHNYGGGVELADYYMNNDPSTRTFMVQDTIQLISGDVDGNKRVKRQDYDAVYDFVYRNRPWNTVKTEPVKPTTPESATSPAWIAYRADMAQWALSVYNPNSWSYRADLDGDRKLTIADVDIVRTLFNYNRTEADYNWRKTEGGVTTSILPFGLGKRDSSTYAALFALGVPVEGEVSEDAYWDQSADLDSEEAEPLDTIWVDEDGQTWQESTRTDTPVVDDDLPTPQPGDRAETPLGEEALEQLEIFRPEPGSILSEEDLSPEELVDITEGGAAYVEPAVPEPPED